ncbi:PAS domain S-box protein [Nocardioides sp. J2M5]|uniref:sensor histidine kinase n=1 Tax=Nocardioides palaemonis TaxID=2829810 RepID=UPI001BAA8C50|nr:ATP-binding protein [Nocardioides palaemonis]MBS2939155.1 PAS domain S-box protein [Nocardioides palaemonis]
MTAQRHPTSADGELYASMVAHHPHAVFSVDREGRYTEANAHARAMTGMSLDEMRRTHFLQTIHPGDHELMLGAFAHVLSGEPIVVEARVVRVDGKVVDIRCTGIPVAVDGEVVGVHGVTEDVTREKQVVRELEEANAAKTLFLASVSHELRTPLAALVGATDLLVHADSPASSGHYVDMVQRAGHQLMHLVDELLEFSGLETHQTVLDVRPFAPRSVVDAVASWAVPLADERGLELSLTVDDAVPATASGDARRLRQVVANLVRNALTFTRAGRVDLRVRTRPHALDPGDAHAADVWVEFIVSDTGCGIDEEHLRTLFEPFARSTARDARPGAGIGLGLAICRALADLMDGCLQVSSAVGEGSTFTFGVPLGRCSAGS